MTTVPSLFPLIIPLTSLMAGIMIFLIPERERHSRSLVNIAGAVFKIFFAGILLQSVFWGVVYEVRLPLFLDFEFILKADALSLLFVSLSSVLWLITTIYAIGYFKNTADQNRFFGFFTLSVCATTGIAMAGNLFTLIVFYELLTITTYPLVIHKGSKEALSGGRVYLIYTMLGGSLLLFALVWLSSLTGVLNFANNDALTNIAHTHSLQLSIIFLLLIIGFGVKAAMVPFHGWLPIAMVAPAPVSALLHAVAVVKAGAFSIVRVIHDLYGVTLSQKLGLLKPLQILASITIIYGSLRALTEDDLKRRLAYSTISQVSYVILGAATLGTAAITGGIVHIVHQGIMKITLFFCAGNLAYHLNINRISQMNGIGHRMPLTMGAFTVAALGLIGVPPFIGFISKWYLAAGALEAQQTWIVVILCISSLLNAGYFLPIIYRAWFKDPDPHFAQDNMKQEKDMGFCLLTPPLITAAFTVLLGAFSGFAFSPLGWAKLVTFFQYGY